MGVSPDFIRALIRRRCSMAEVDTQQLDRLLNTVRTLEPLIREHADEAERNRRLSQPVVTALAEAGLFRLYTPRTLGGFEVDPLTCYHVLEEIARIDGSTAWCVWIGGTAAIIAGNLADQVAEEIFGRDPQVVTAGGIFPFGKAMVRDGGYVVSGRWPYVSGCQHSAWFFFVCNVFAADQVRLTEPGNPEVRVVSVPAAQGTILDTWEVSGLAGTGSHDVVLEQVFVPEEYTCPFGPGMTPQGKCFQSPVYRCPLYASAVGSLGAAALGIAQGAVDTCLELAQSKRPAGTTALLRERPLFHIRLAEAVALVRSARAWLHASVQQTWEAREAILAGGQVSFDERADVLLAAANATRNAAAAVDIVYTVAGATANYRRSPLQRALRDIHAVTQHVGTAPQQYESAGRMLLGLQPLQPAFILL
jgi:alkylation response protein AidB-like acyl-CoA dehydrogenase